MTTWTLTDNGDNIVIGQTTDGVLASHTLLKSVMSQNFPYMISVNYSPSVIYVAYQNDKYDINIREVLSPVVTSAKELYDKLIDWIYGNLETITKVSIGLGNVDNTSDLNKAVSTASQTALDAKAPVVSPTFTGTVSGITKSMVGLGSVDNTADASKPVSTATQTAIDLKANITSPTFTGTVSGITKSMVGLSDVVNSAVAFGATSTTTVGIVSVNTRVLTIGGVSITVLTT